jgi:hypothetical protein
LSSANPVKIGWEKEVQGWEKFGSAGVFIRLGGFDFILGLLKPQVDLDGGLDGLFEI